jgi:hypothetical protein
MEYSYLWRLTDAIQMDLVTEIVIGKEVLTRLPKLVKDWSKE